MPLHFHTINNLISQWENSHIQEPEQILTCEYLRLYFLRERYPRTPDTPPEILQLLNAQRDKVDIAGEGLSKEANSRCYHTARGIFNTCILQLDQTTMAGRNIEQITRSRTSSNGHKRKAQND